MKKALFGLVLACLVLPLFSDDALVMPSHVIRTYFVGNYAMISKSFDDDGKKKDTSDVKALNLGVAVEYGFNDWVSGAAQWVPGYNVYSKLDSADKGNLGDPADLFVGAKVQIVGPKAPVQNDVFRFALAPGLKIPISHPDWDEEAADYSGGKDFLAQSSDLHVFGFGSRAFFDYVVSEEVFLNLYSQILYFPGKQKAKDSSLANNLAVAGVKAALDPSYDPSLQYGYDLTLEFEPHYNKMIADGLEFEAGLPITYNTAPAVKVSDDPYGKITADDAKYSLSVGPNVSLFFQKAFIPLELELGYTLPILGRNTSAANVLLLELKAYAKL